MPIRAIVSGVENDIKRIPMKGRNLFDISSVKTGKFVRAGNVSESHPLGEEISNSGYDCSDYIAVSAGMQYTVKYPAFYDAAGAGLVYFDADKNAISGVPLHAQGGETYSFTIPVNCAYIRLSWHNINGDTCMLNLGSIPLPYEPYGYQEGWEVRDNQNRLIWGREEALTGTSSISFKGAGIPLKSVDIFGNTQQTGTPTPDNPVMPEFVGVRTANLWDPDSRVTNQAGQMNWGVVLPAGTYTIKNNSAVTVYYRDGLDATTASRFANAGNTATKTTTNDMVAWCNSSQPNIMLNSGSTALPYEPFGWAEKITCGGQTTPVYLGQTQTVRRVKKLVLDGTENWSKSSAQAGRYNLAVNDYLKARGEITSICTHFAAVAQRTGGQYPDKSQSFYAGSDATRFMFLHDADIETLADFKSYLAEQYAAGTPVTVWYVLAEPETGIVNEPLAKIGDYADELHSTDSAVTIPTVKGQNALTVDTTLPPSSTSITGHITSAS